jgi:hypothetical protein
MAAAVPTSDGAAIAEEIDNICSIMGHELHSGSGMGREEAAVVLVSSARAFAALSADPCTEPVIVKFTLREVGGIVTVTFPPGFPSVPLEVALAVEGVPAAVESAIRERAVETVRREKSVNGFSAR